MQSNEPAAVNLPLPTPGRRPALCVMVLGTSSGAGKSWVATALCAWYRAQGYKVAPFKAQNMSNNARVVSALVPQGRQVAEGIHQGLCQALTLRLDPILVEAR